LKNKKNFDLNTLLFNKEINHEMLQIDDLNTIEKNDNNYLKTKFNFEREKIKVSKII
jgi:hypothetical protein